MVRVAFRTLGLQLGGSLLDLTGRPTMHVLCETAHGWGHLTSHIAQCMLTRHRVAELNPE